MKQFKMYAAGALLVIMSLACQEGSFQRTKSGVMFKIVSTDTKNQVIKHGQIMRFDFIYKVRDTVIMSSYETGFPEYYLLDTANLAASYSDGEVFPFLRQGDSALIVLEADTLFKQGQQVPPFIKPKDKINVFIKVRNVFNSWADLPAKKGFTRTPTGLLYKISSTEQRKTVLDSQIVRFTFRQFLNDSLLVSSNESGDGFERIERNTKADYKIGDVLSQLGVGDSATIIFEPEIIRVKSRGMPPNFKSTDRIILGIRVTHIYENEVLAKKDKDAEDARIQRLLKEKEALQKAKDYGILNEYISKNNIKVTKAAKGTLVEITNAGTGPACLPGKVAMVMYTGKLLNGKAFDSNVDPAFNHAGQPYPVKIGEMGVIQGWDDGLRLFRKGGKGRLLIPSFLGYGAQGNPPTIEPHANLIFDIEIVNILDSMPPMGDMPGQQ